MCCVLEASAGVARRQRNFILHLSLAQQPILFATNASIAYDAARCRKRRHRLSHAGMGPKGLILRATKFSSWRKRRLLLALPMEKGKVPALYVRPILAGPLADGTVPTPQWTPGYDTINGSPAHAPMLDTASSKTSSRQGGAHCLRRRFRIVAPPITAAAACGRKDIVEP